MYPGIAPHGSDATGTNGVSVVEIDVTILNWNHGDPCLRARGSLAWHGKREIMTHHKDFIIQKEFALGVRAGRWMCMFWNQDNPYQCQHWCIWNSFWPQDQDVLQVSQILLLSFGASISPVILAIWIIASPTSLCSTSVCSLFDKHCPAWFFLLLLQACVLSPWSLASSRENMKCLGDHLL